MQECVNLWAGVCLHSHLYVCVPVCDLWTSPFSTGKAGWIWGCGVWGSLCLPLTCTPAVLGQGGAAACV